MSSQNTAKQTCSSRKRQACKEIWVNVAFPRKRAANSAVVSCPLRRHLARTRQLDASRSAARAPATYCPTPTRLAYNKLTLSNFNRRIKYVLVLTFTKTGSMEQSSDPAYSF